MNRTTFIFLSLFSIILCLAGIFRYGHGVSANHQTVPPVQMTQNRKSEPSEEIRFLTNYNEARNAAHEENKPILLFFTTPTCVFSKRMLDTTFRNPEVCELLEKFILVRIDLTSNASLWQEFHIESSPTIQFVSSNGILLHRLSGETKPELLMVQLNNTLHALSARRSDNGTVTR
ncbi:MAG: thioredoxin family protein [Planctomycetaceae bacterium]|nr:thioredoxin family protein [Planctomycetaceae bacterium]